MWFIPLPSVISHNQHITAESFRQVTLGAFCRLFLLEIQTKLTVGAGGAERNVVIAALNDTRGGDNSELGFALEIRNGEYAAVAHGDLTL